MNQIFKIFMAVWLVWTTNLISIQAQNELVKCGPMVGYTAMREVALWIQVTREAEVRFGWKPALQKGASWTFSSTGKTHAGNAFIYQTSASMLEPGTEYLYHVWVDGKEIKTAYPLTFKTQALWNWRTDPPDFRFIAGSCFYVNEDPYDRPGRPYGGGYSIYSEMVKDKADFMVWLGDNTYFREVDYDSRSGLYHRHSHSRSVPELQPLLGSIAHYAVWDDHDYGPNDSYWTYPLKFHARDAFRDYWPSSTYGTGHTEGITSWFYWNDCEFFMLDNRWYRTVETSGSILGETQKWWLLESLKASKAAFKFVCIGGQFISDAKVFENYANYEEERNEIIQYLDENDIKGVVFLTGDRHHSEISKMKTEKGNIFYDITSSPVLSGAGNHEDEANQFRLPKTMIGERNYALIEVTGPRKERAVTVIFKNTAGQEINRYKLSAE